MVKISSVKPSKQRKKVFKAPYHVKRQIMSAHLSEDLRDKHKRRAFPIRIGDTVKILRGDFSGIEGKITEIERSGAKLYMDGVTREKASGETMKVPVHSSNVMITNLNLDDKWRKQALERGTSEKKSKVKG